MPRVKGVRWQALEARATLDRDGARRVTEDIVFVVTGRPVFAARSFRPCLPCELTMTSLARLESASGTPHLLTKGRPDAAGHYRFENDTTWTLRGSGDPDFADGTTLTYRLEYAVAGSVIPISGVRGFGTSSIISPYILHPLKRAAELWEAWRLAPGGLTRRVSSTTTSPRSRFWRRAQSVRRPPATDPSWQFLMRPGPVRAPVAEPEDLREFLPLDFTRPGRPATVNKGLQAAWMAPLVALPVYGFALAGILLARARSLKRRFDQAPVDEDWIQQQLLSRSPEEVRRLVAENDSGPIFPGAPAMLEEMARQGIVALDGPPETGALRLCASRETLPPRERTLVGALFGADDKVSAAAVQKRIESRNLDLDRAAREAFAASRPGGRSVAALVRTTPTIVLIALGVVLPLSILAGGGFQALATGLVLGSMVFQLARPVLGHFSRSLELPWLPLTALVAAVLLFSFGTIVFFLTRARLSTRHSRPRVALSWTLMVARDDGLAAVDRQRNLVLRYGMARAKRYVGAELEKPRPALIDSWLPWIHALGLGTEVENWRRGRGMFAARPPAGTPASAARWTGGTQAPTAAPGWTGRFLRGAGA